MARARFVRPEFFTDDKMGELPRDVRLLFIGLWTVADLNGVLEWRPKQIRIQVFPFDEDVTSARIEEWMRVLETARRVEIYQSGEATYLRIVHFKKHQSFTESELKSGPKHPLPPGFIIEDTRKRGGYTRGTEVDPECSRRSTKGALAGASPSPSPSPSPAPAPAPELERHTNVTERPAHPGLDGPGARARREVNDPQAVKKPTPEERKARSELLTAALVRSGLRTAEQEPSANTGT